LAYFADIWYIISHSGKLHQQKSGNPALDLYELVVCTNSGNLGHNCAISKVPVMNVITRMSHLVSILRTYVFGQKNFGQILIRIMEKRHPKILKVKVYLSLFNIF
jgi:hypothetical protein